MWFSLSGSNGNKVTVENRNINKKRVSSLQVAKAEVMGRNWKIRK
jgi:hypothetical protein